MCSLYAGGRVGWALFCGGDGGDALCTTLFAGRARSAGGDALCANLLAGGVEGVGGDAMFAAQGVGGAGAGSYTLCAL